MSVRFSVLPADLAKGDVVQDLNGHTVEEIMLDGPSPYSVRVNGPEWIVVHTWGPDKRLHTWKCDPNNRVTVLDW